MSSAVPCEDVRGLDVQMNKVGGHDKYNNLKKQKGPHIVCFHSHEKSKLGKSAKRSSRLRVA